MSTESILCSAGPNSRAYPGIPDSWSASMKSRAQQDLDLVAAHLPAMAEHTANIDPYADVEDFWEPLARSAAAVRAAQKLGSSIEFTEPGYEWDDQSMARRLGSVWSHEEDKHQIDPILMHPMIKEHGGRWMSLAGISDEEPLENDLVDLALGRAALGIEKLVVKMGASKTGLFTIDLHAAITADEIYSQIYAADGYALIHLVGLPNTMLVQDWVAMEYEYRIFIVDGKVISGAGCVEEFTPYSRENTSTSFDSRMRRIRGNQIAGDESTEVRIRPGRVDLYLEAAQRWAAQYQGTIGMDLATVKRADGSQQIVIVELNTLPNSGLYASNVDAVYEALSTAQDRGYRTYGWKVDINLYAVNAQPL